jgi:hypothetical protein
VFHGTLDASRVISHRSLAHTHPVSWQGLVGLTCTRASSSSACRAAGSHSTSYARFTRSNSASAAVHMEPSVRCPRVAPRAESVHPRSTTTPRGGGGHVLAFPRCHLLCALPPASLVPSCFHPARRPPLCRLAVPTPPAASRQSAILTSSASVTQPRHPAPPRTSHEGEPQLRQQHAPFFFLGSGTLSG